MESTGQKRNFPPPWPVEKTEDCYIVKDANGVTLASVQYWDRAQQWTFASKHLTSDEARRIANAIARLPEFLMQRSGFYSRDGGHDRWKPSRPYHVALEDSYCEAHGIPLKAFGNWRAKFKAEPQLPDRKLLYRRRGLSHSVSHSLSHMTYGCAEPIVPPAREGHRRKFSEADKRRIVEEAVQPGASLSEVARRYGIAARVLFGWKQELTQAHQLNCAPQTRVRAGNASRPARKVARESRIVIGS
ncbi:MAG: hypothetical protein JWP25_5458 [Bradyrhizobium sp.]|nr:hypothetical protein [Bradyrhizobium sp.]